MLNWRQNTRNTKVELYSDTVKVDSGFYAVFTEQGSSASQMTAAKIMDIISRLPGCDGQATNAVSACTQVKMKDAHKLLKIPKSEFPDIRIRPPRHEWPKSWSSMEDPVVPLEKNCTVILWQDYCGKGNLRKFHWNMGWENIPNWKCLFVHREKDYSYLPYLMYRYFVLTKSMMHWRYTNLWSRLYSDLILEIIWLDSSSHSQLKSKHFLCLFVLHSIDTSEMMTWLSNWIEGLIKGYVHYFFFFENEFHWHGKFTS